MNIDDMNIQARLYRIDTNTADCCSDKDIYYRKDGLNSHVIECVNCKAIETDRYFYDMIVGWNKRFGVKELECQELLSRCI